MDDKYNKISIDDLLVQSTSRTRSQVRKPRPSPTVFRIECKYHGCNRKFASLENLRAHERRQHAAPTSFACEYCHATFSTSPNRNKHVRSVHEKKKPFKCSTCGITFGFRDGLQRHMEMVHYQLRPFSCTYCGQKFKTKSHMLSHSFSLHPEKHLQDQDSIKKTSTMRTVIQTHTKTKLQAS